MSPELQNVSEDTLINVGISIDKLLKELSETTGKSKQPNEVYMLALKLSLTLVAEYCSRLRAKYNEPAAHNKDYDYKDKLTEN